MHRNSSVFLSHSYSDKNPVKERLIKDLSGLNQHGIDIWRAETNIIAGTDIMAEISKAIQESDYFLQILSDRKGSWINAEIEMAVASQIAKQNLKIITAITAGHANSQTLLGQGARGLVINFSGDYDDAFRYLIENIRPNVSDTIIKFDLQSSLKTEPIIVVSNKVNAQLIDYFSKHPHELKTIDRRLFEELVAELFDGFGYAVELTQKTRDGGRDIVAIRDEETHIKYLIECKRPDVGNKIGIRPVRELLGVKQDEKATKAILATTSYFSPDALQFFDRNKWELEHKDFDGLMTWIDMYKKKRGIN